MSDKFLEVEYDAANAKLYAPRRIEGVVKVLPTPAFKTVTDSSYTISVDDSEKFLVFDSSDVNITLGSGIYRQGTKIRLLSGESNQISLLGSGVTLHSTATNASSNLYFNRYSYSKIKLTCIATDTWIVEGDVASELNKNYVVTSAAGKYVFNGDGLSDAENPDLALSVDQFLEIDYQGGSGHPFWIKKGNVSGAATGSGLAQPGWARVINNGTNNTANKLRISFKESGDYYYICELHSTMKGAITVS